MLKRSQINQKLTGQHEKISDRWIKRLGDEEAAKRSRPGNAISAVSRSIPTAL